MSFNLDIFESGIKHHKPDINMEDFICFRCPQGFNGSRCETPLHSSAHGQQEPDSKQLITIIVPVIAGIILVLVILVVLIIYRRKR